MYFVERLRETSVGEDGFQDSLQHDVRQTTVEPRVLEHVEHKQHALAGRLRTNQVLQLLCAPTANQQQVKCAIKEKRKGRVINRVI